MSKLLNTLQLLSLAMNMPPRTNFELFNKLQMKNKHIILQTKKTKGLDQGLNLQIKEIFWGGKKTT
jgi:hypothetical protein